MSCSYTRLGRIIFAVSLSLVFNVSAAEKSGPLPAPIAKAMSRSKIPASQLSVTVIPLTGKDGHLNFNGNVRRTPASIEKVITGAAALELLGPAKHWHTTAYAKENADTDGVLKSDIYIAGKGDPELTLHGIWEMLDMIRSSGVKTIEGNFVIDRSLFNIPSHDPFAFDGDGNRPYNIGADAFLVNSRSMVIRIRPNAKEGVAHLYHVPTIEKGLKLPKTIPLSNQPCGAWRKQIEPDFSNPNILKFNGKFPLKCGNKDFFYTTMKANQYLTVVFEDFWNKLGGVWKGKLVEGKLPDDRKDLKVLGGTTSEPLAKIIYDMNKHSINPMARQLFLLLGQTDKGTPKTLEASRKTIQTWLGSKGIDPRNFYLENGSGLSRKSFLTTESLSKLLADMWNSNVMPEYLASLPISGVDGTMRKRHPADGFARVKTGYISGVRSIAGYVKSKNGNYFAVSAVINGSGAAGSVPVLDAIISWIHNR